MEEKPAKRILRGLAAAGVALTILAPALADTPSQVVRSAAIDSDAVVSLHILRDQTGVRLVGVAPRLAAPTRLRDRLAGAVDAPVLGAPALAPGGSAPPAWRRLEDAAVAMTAALDVGRVSIEAGGLSVSGAPASMADAARIRREAAALRRIGVAVETSLSAPVAPAAYLLAVPAPGDGFQVAPCSDGACAGRIDEDRTGWRPVAHHGEGPGGAGVLDDLATRGDPQAATDGAWLALEIDGATVTLRGAAPDRATRLAVTALTHAHFSGFTIDDALADGGTDGAEAGWRLAALTLVETAAALGEGAAHLRDDAVSLRGRATDAEAALTAAEQLRLLEQDGWRVEAALTTPTTRPAAQSDAAQISAAPGDPAPAKDCAARLEAQRTRTPLRFGAGEAMLDAANAPALDALASILKTCAALRVEIGGHTDADGPYDANMALSTRRAAAVRAALTARGVDAALLTARGYGPDDPVADNATAAGRAANRRIAFRVTGPADDVAAPDAGAMTTPQTMAATPAPYAPVRRPAL